MTSPSLNRRWWLFCLVLGHVIVIILLLFIIVVLVIAVVAVFVKIAALVRRGLLRVAMASLWIPPMLTSRQSRRRKSDNTAYVDNKCWHCQSSWSHLRGLTIRVADWPLALPVFGPFWSVVVRVITVRAGAAGGGVVLRRGHNIAVNCLSRSHPWPQCSSTERYYVGRTSIKASYFLSVPSPPLRSPLLSGLFVSFPGVSVTLFFFLFSFLFFLLLVLLFLLFLIHLCSFFVFLLNSNSFVIYFSIF